MPSAQPGERRQGVLAEWNNARAVAVLFFAVLGLLVALEKLPALLLVAYVLLSVVTFFLYGADKSAAKRGQWRTPESTLLLAGLLGGWPGALVARHFFRHKTIKQPFRTWFWISVLANCSALAGFLYFTGV